MVGTIYKHIQSLIPELTVSTKFINSIGVTLYLEEVPVIDVRNDSRFYYTILDDSGFNNYFNNDTLQTVIEELSYSNPDSLEMVIEATKELVEALNKIRSIKGSKFEVRMD